MTRIGDEFVPGASPCSIAGNGKAVLPRYQPVQWNFCGSGWFSGVLTQAWVSSAAVAAVGVTRLRQRLRSARQIHTHFNEGMNRFQFICAAGTHIVLVAVYGGSRLTLDQAQHIAALAGPSQ